GNTEPNSTVNIYDGTTLIGTTTSDGNGDYTFTPTTPLDDGSHTISVTVTDNAGNTLATTPITFNIDTTVLVPSNTTTTITVNDITSDNTINSTEASGNVTISGSVSGVYTTGDSVKVSVNGNDYNTSVNSNGTFSVEVAGSDLVADSNSNIDVTLIATNSVGNTGTITTDKSYTVDTSVSSLSVNITDDAGNTTGTISNGTLTDDNTPTISGNTEPNSTVNIYDGTTLIGTTTSDGNGDYTFTPTTPLDDGSHTISVTVTDNAGNTLATTPITFNIDTTVLVPSNTTTTITVNDITSDNTINSTEASGNVTISGSVSGVYTTGDSVKVSVNGNDYNTSVNSNGTFSVEVAGSDLVADSNSNIDVTLIATNSVGNTGTITTDKSYTVDTSVSSLSVNITDDAGNTTGTISNGTLTDDNTPTISGNTEPNSTVNIYDGTTLIGTTTSDGNGDYTFTPTTPLDDGSHTISVTVTDNAGNTLATTPITFNIDTTVPNNPIITNIIDTNGDYSNVVMHGTGEAGATITLYAQQGSTTAGNNTGSNTYIAIATAIVATNGSWSIDISNIPDVPINDNEFFYVTQTDKSGNTSLPSDSVHYWHGDWVNSNMENNDDYIMAGNGNDAVTINVNDTNDYTVIDGGNGNDTAILKGNMSDYSITTNSEGHIIVTHSSTNTDSDNNGIGDQVELRNVETIKFADGTYDVIKGTFIPTISIVTTIVTEDNAQIIGTAQDTDGTISLASYSANNGTVTLDTNGNIIYTPNNNYSGSDNITFTIIDDKGATVTQTINLTINAVADSPTANIQVQATGNSFPSLNNLVANGSFEDISGKDSKGNIVSDVNITPSGWIGRTSITGWHLINDANSNAPVMEIHHKEHASVGATNGDNYMDLGETHNTCDHDNDNTQIGQTLSGLTNGTTYLLSFDYFDKAFLQEGGLNGQNSGKLEVYWGGELIATIDDNNTIWKTKTLEVVGGSGNGSNLLSFKEVGEGGDNWGIAIDNVILVEKQGLIEYNIDISAALTDNDGSEALSVLITGVPTNGILTSSLYNLINNNDGTWRVEIPQGTHSISDDSIILLVPSNQTDFKLGIKAKATEISDPTGNTYAETTAIMPALIEVNDTMIQNGNQYIITGSSEANINITVTIGNITKTVQTDSSGKWHVNFLDTELPINKNIVATITSIDTYGNTNQITQGLILVTSGLQAEYFGYKEGQDGSNLLTLNQVDNFIANKTADATFTASKIDYYMSGGDLGKGTNLQTFIGNDATTLSNDPSDTSDAIIKFNGQIMLSAGTYNFKVTGDDGYRIIIDGKIVAQYDGIQSATTREHPSFNIDDDGLHNMEILYWDQAGVAKLKIEIKEEGGQYNIIDDNILKYSIDQTSNNNLEYDENSSLIDGGVGNDVLALISGQNIDFSKIGNVIKNIEEIDLSANGKNELANITLQDVVDMTDSKNEIKITGTTEDKVTLSSEWKLNTTLSDTDFNVYSNDDETVKLKIQNDITDVTIG
ncbi:MAG: Ig-like domain-containing protein, partial [Arcobacteraceae bacterium]|nr:Ig-like domain-containing protein [Arcobacteraceae bacterium]